MRDIYELIRQREAEIERFQREIDRVQKEMDALRIAARLLEDNSEAPRPVAVAAAPVAREAQVYSATPASRPASTATATPVPWASAKQFP